LQSAPQLDIGTEPDCFRQYAGNIFGAARWILEALAQRIPGCAIRAKQDGAQLCQRLIVGRCAFAYAVGGHGVGARQV
jgi:hypothetical protein